jgi:hypothetical protein
MSGGKNLFPLTHEEHIQLRTIFRTRLKFLLVVWVGLYVIAFCTSGNLASFAGYQYLLDEDWSKVDWSRLKDEIEGFALFIGFISSIGVVLFLSRVLPYRRDYRRGHKEAVTFTITAKLHFPITKQYFISLNDAAHLHHEVDETVYHNCCEGGFVILYRAPRSRHVFEHNGRFTLI